MTRFLFRVHASTLIFRKSRHRLDLPEQNKLCLEIRFLSARSSFPARSKSAEDDQIINRPGHHYTKKAL
jgi:hypothetical protein